MNMIRKLSLVTSLLLLSINQVQAEIIDVTGSPSTLGAMAAVIDPPSDVLNDCSTGESQLGFNEAQGVVTTAPLNADDGVVIPAGTLVDSHMIFFNQPGTVASHANAVWTFKRPIIAVMSNTSGSLEVASSGMLAAPGTNYRTSPSPHDATCKLAPPFGGRGLETTSDTPPYKHHDCPNGDDCYSVDGNTITVTMVVLQPGDWMRVITKGAQKVAFKVKQDDRQGCIEANRHAAFQVAILGSAKFDASKIDASTISFAGMSVRSSGDNSHGDEHNNRKTGEPQCMLQDTNKDGIRDLVCQFKGDASNLSRGNVKAELDGSLQDGTAFEGSDTICVR